MKNYSAFVKRNIQQPKENVIKNERIEIVVDEFGYQLDEPIQKKKPIQIFDEINIEKIKE